MARRTGCWLVDLEGYPPVSTDDLTLDELEVAERVSGVPWSLMDPHVSVRIAKALLGLLLVKANVATGMAPAAAEDDAMRRVGRLPVRQLHGAFTYLPPGDPRATASADQEAENDPPALAPTSVAG